MAAAPNGSSIFPLTTPTTPILAEFLQDSYVQLLQLINSQCAPGASPSFTGGITLAGSSSGSTTINAAASSFPPIFDLTHCNESKQFRSLQNRQCRFTHGFNDAVQPRRTCSLAGGTSDGTTSMHRTFSSKRSSARSRLVLRGPGVPAASPAGPRHAQAH